MPSSPASIHRGNGLNPGVALPVPGAVGLDPSCRVRRPHAVPKDAVGNLSLCLGVIPTRARIVVLDRAALPLEVRIDLIDVMANGSRGDAGTVPAEVLAVNVAVGGESQRSVEARRYPTISASGGKRHGIGSSSWRGGVTRLDFHTGDGLCIEIRLATPL